MKPCGPSPAVWPISPTSKVCPENEPEQYLAHRRRITGVDQPPFDADAKRAIYKITRGNYRACDHWALTALQVANDRNAGLVNANHIAQAGGQIT